MPQTTIKQLLQQARERIDLLDAELIVAHVLKKTREFVLAHPDQLITASQHHLITELFEKRGRGVPLAYLTKHKEFFGLDFMVNRSVLVPRPETEVLVESVLSECRMQTTGGKKIALIDVGTGSGCIPIAIAASLHHPTTPSLKIYAIDISKSALRIAELNAKKHGVKIKFLHGSLLQPLVDNLTIQQFNNLSAGEADSTLVITANLPYLTNKQHKNSPSIQREPKNALVAGKTGLELYEKLLSQMKDFTAYGLWLTAFFEINPRQANRITRLIKKYLPNASVEIKKDLSGRDRVVVLTGYN
ncbi:MAG: peptide chain release factor N(5)-glutamine methyltransferase [Candidatus Magasanikbacteria bacterium]|nr:peptide chain release factor N(5)-glutamine methyltransferase [Candidatus Magasanikbacteria bacterium]